MAKNNNLQDYLKDLYAGISTVKPNASKDPQQFRSEIESLASPEDATAAAADIRLGETAYTSDGKVTGTIEDYDNTLIGPAGVKYAAPDGTKPIIFYDEMEVTHEGYCVAQANDNYPYAASYKATHQTVDVYDDMFLCRVYFEVPESYESNQVEVKIVGYASTPINQGMEIHYLYSVDTPLDLNTDQEDMEELWLFERTGQMWNLKSLADRTITDNLTFKGAGTHFVDVLVNFYGFGTNDTGTADIIITVAKEV